MTAFHTTFISLIGEICPDIRVIRNDDMTVEEIEALAPDRIILSPGPGRPEDAGVIIEAARTVSKRRYRLSVFVLVIRLYVRLTERMSHMQRNSCTASSLS